jgi:uncharacterized protein YacL
MIDFIQCVLLLGILAKLFSPELGSIRSLRQRKIILDSCALIDGRIIDLSQAGFMSSALVVPDFVVHELQLLADGTDAHKRERARYGLDVIKELQESTYCDLTVNKNTLPTGLPTDDKLIVLAKKLKAQLYTTDFNLQKVAEIAGVSVLNVNDIAQKLRPTALPGERKTIKLLQKGSNPKQGVGYLEDGTMVVVENGARGLGKTVEVEITRTHQTVSGKMLFGELVKIPVTAAPVKPARPLMPKFKTSAPGATRRSSTRRVER